MAQQAVVVNLTKGRLAVYVECRRVWVGKQSEWAEARRVAAESDAARGVETVR